MCASRAAPVAGATLAGHLAGGYDVDWGALAAKLPVGKDRQSKVAREKLWRKADTSGNGFLSLAEIDKALHDEHGYEELFGTKPVLMRAFQSARKAVKSKDGGGDDHVEKAEFRLLLVALRQVFEVYLMFNQIDTSDDRRISLEEFTSKLPELRKWGATLEDAEAEFRRIDYPDPRLTLTPPPAPAPTLTPTLIRPSSVGSTRREAG
jgi:hypothetical protein